MGGISIWQLLIIVVMLLVPLILFGPIAKKAGYSYWAGLLMAVPLLNLVLVWVFAFTIWPIENSNKANQSGTR